MAKTMNQFYTSIEQSKKLLELGLSPESADMFYAKRWDEPVIISDNYDNTPCYDESDNTDIPCWSVGALLEVMPEIEYKDYPKRFPKLLHYDGYQFDHYCHCTKEYYNIIDAAYEMVVWLLENNYIKKEK